MSNKPHALMILGFWCYGKQGIKWTDNIVHQSLLVPDPFILRMYMLENRIWQSKTIMYFAVFIIRNVST